MRIVFFGTPEYTLPVLTSLHKTFKSKSGISPIVAVVTQSPKPVGRKKVLTYSPVDKWAHERKIPVYYHCKKLLEENVSADLGVLASFGQIIPKEVINLFTHGILNVHPSLLPKYRGASPVRAAIVSGDKETGVTIIKLDEEVDHGLVISQFTEEVQTKDTTEILSKSTTKQSTQPKLKRNTALFLLNISLLPWQAKPLKRGGKCPSSKSFHYPLAPMLWKASFVPCNLGLWPGRALRSLRPPSA
jgi:methionyl-tRNA formyltransferase